MDKGENGGKGLADFIPCCTQQSMGHRPLVSI